MRSILLKMASFDLPPNGGEVAIQKEEAKMRSIL